MQAQGIGDSDIAGFGEYEVSRKHEKYSDRPIGISSGELN